MFTLIIILMSVCGQAMLEDKLRETDWELTQESIEEQVARESYLQWLKEQEAASRQPGPVSKAGSRCLHGVLGFSHRLNHSAISLCICVFLLCPKNRPVLFKFQSLAVQLVYVFICVFLLGPNVFFLLCPKNRPVLFKFQSLAVQLVYVFICVFLLGPNVFFLLCPNNRPVLFKFHSHSQCS